MYQEGALYQVFPDIVIVLPAMFIVNFWTELQGKHCQYCYDYNTLAVEIAAQNHSNFWLLLLGVSAEK